MKAFLSHVKKRENLENEKTISIRFFI